MTTARIHPTAFVEEGVILENEVEIWHHSQIRSGARIGERTKIGKNVYVDGGVQVGRDCKIQNNALLYRSATLNAGVFVGPGAVLTNDRHPRAINPDGSPRTDADWHPGEIIVEEGASVGAASVILSSVRIGRWAVVAAGAVVAKDVPDHGVVAGAPARLLGKACFCGRLRSDQCPDCGWQPER